MANVKEIYVEVSFTKNLGNYESLKPTAGVLMTVKSNDDIDKVYNEAWELVGNQIVEQLRLFEKEDSAKKGIKRGL